MRALTFLRLTTLIVIELNSLILFLQQKDLYIIFRGICSNMNHKEHNLKNTRNNQKIITNVFRSKTKNTLADLHQLP